MYSAAAALSAARVPHLGMSCVQPRRLKLDLNRLPENVDVLSSPFCHKAHPHRSLALSTCGGALIGRCLGLRGSYRARPSRPPSVG